MRFSKGASHMKSLVGLVSLLLLSLSIGSLASGPAQPPSNGIAYPKGWQACIACHTPVKGRDWVFTEPAQIPR